MYVYVNYCACVSDMDMSLTRSAIPPWQQRHRHMYAQRVLGYFVCIHPCMHASMLLCDVFVNSLQRDFIIALTHKQPHVQRLEHMRTNNAVVDECRTSFLHQAVFRREK